MKLVKLHVCQAEAATVKFFGWNTSPFSLAVLSLDFRHKTVPTPLPLFTICATLRPGVNNRTVAWYPVHNIAPHWLITPNYNSCKTLDEIINELASLKTSVQTRGGKKRTNVEFTLLWQGQQNSFVILPYLNSWWKIISLSLLQGTTAAFMWPWQAAHKMDAL
jgi:hypothetical protein